jgi:hypothetical protein
MLSFEEFTWGCLFTVETTAIDTVDGGTTTVANGNAVKVTENSQTITVTQTVQQTSTATSIIAAAANTVSVTSTVTQHGTLVKKHLPQAAEPEESRQFSMKFLLGQIWNTHTSTPPIR